MLPLVAKELDRRYQERVFVVDNLDSTAREEFQKTALGASHPDASSRSSRYRAAFKKAKSRLFSEFRANSPKFCAMKDSMIRFKFPLKRTLDLSKIPKQKNISGGRIKPRKYTGLLDLPERVMLRVVHFLGHFCRTYEHLAATLATLDLVSRRFCLGVVAPSPTEFVARDWYLRREAQESGLLAFSWSGKLQYSWKRRLLSLDKKLADVVRQCGGNLQPRRGRVNLGWCSLGPRLPLVVTAMMRHMIPKPRSHHTDSTSASAPASAAVAGGQVGATLEERVVLDVGWSQSTEEDFRVVELVLNDNALDDHSMEAILARALTESFSFLHLRVLNLEDNSIGDSGCASLAVALQSRALRVREVYLGGNRVGNIGAVAMVKALVQAIVPTIEVIGLGGNSITDIGAEKLLQMVQDRAKNATQSGQVVGAASSAMHLRSKVTPGHLGSKIKSSSYTTRTRKAATTAGKTAVFGSALGLTLRTLFLSGNRIKDKCWSKLCRNNFIEIC